MRQCQGNPVLAYLHREGAAGETVALFSGEPRSLVPEASLETVSFAVPISNEPYARVSGDTNPIHVNPYIAVLAGLVQTHYKHSQICWLYRFVTFFATAPKSRMSIAAGHHHPRHVDVGCRPAPGGDLCGGQPAATRPRLRCGVYRHGAAR